ncbi:MAG: DUF2085 domain-containing protein [Betaproteobacteria bacterium]
MDAMRRAFVGAAVGWAAALPAAAFAATHARADSLPLTLAFFAYAAGSAVCHQRPERSFFLWAAQMPVCARCTGIYLGAAVAAVTASGFRRRAEHLARSVAAARGTLLLAAVPTAATLVYEWTTGIMPSNVLRAGSGLLLGAAVAVLVIGSLAPGAAVRVPNSHS